MDGPIQASYFSARARCRRFVAQPPNTPCPGLDVASEVSYWCNRRETSEVAKQARAARHSYVHVCLVYIISMSMCVAIVGPCACDTGCWHLLFNVRQCMVNACIQSLHSYEFRRGFCTLVLFILSGSRRFDAVNSADFFF